MARIKSGAFVGSPPRDVVADASIFRRWLRDAVGDTALVSDKATGENATTAIRHTGAGDGCQLRLPLAAQHIDVPIILEGSGVIVGEQDFYVLAVPVWVAEGERNRCRLTVTMKTPAGLTPKAEVRDTSWALDWGPFDGEQVDLVEEVADGAGRISREQTWSWDVPFVAEGLNYLCVKRPIRFISSDPDGRLINWTLHHLPPLGVGGVEGVPQAGGSAVVGDVYPASSTFTPSTDHDTYDEEVTVDGPLSSYVLTRLNRQINTLWEYVTGAKLPGNNAYQCATTWDNNRSSFTNEGLLDFPMAIVALGSMIAVTGKPGVNSYTAPTEGLLDWMCFPQTQTTTNANITSAVMVCPSFRTSPSALKCSVLIHTPNGAADAANWRFRVTSTAGTATAVAPVQIGTSNMHVATVAAVPFTQSLANTFNVQVAHSVGGGGAVTEEIEILGCVFYFEP